VGRVGTLLAENTPRGGPKHSNHEGFGGAPQPTAPTKARGEKVKIAHLTRESVGGIQENWSGAQNRYHGRGPKKQGTRLSPLPPRFKRLLPLAPPSLTLFQLCWFQHRNGPVPKTTPPPNRPTLWGGTFNHQHFPDRLKRFLWCGSLKKPTSNHLVQPFKKNGPRRKE